MSRNKPPTDDWRDVYQSLRTQIEEGELTPGEPLPTIAGLAGQSGLTLHGARRIMGRLRDEGWAQSWQGLGYRVAEPQLAYRIDRRPWFNANMSRIGRESASDLIGARIVSLSRELATQMRLSTGTRVYQAEMVRYVEKRPVILARNYYPMDRCDGILDALASTRSVTKAFAKLGLDSYTRVGTRIEARLPKAQEAMTLSIPNNQPVMVTTGVNIDDDGDVVELSHSVSRADCVTFEV